MPNPRTFDGRSSAVAATGERERSLPKRKAASRISFKYLKSRDFPIHLLAAWWIFWLVASYTDLNEFIPPSGETVTQYAVFILSFLFGHWLVKQANWFGLGTLSKRIRPFRSSSRRVRFALVGAALLCSAMLLASLWLAGALSSDFIEYFAKRRMDEGGLEGLTGIRTLDVLTKILAFPLSYTIVLIVLGSDIRGFRLTLAICIINLLAFAYLWQVNYPLIHLFWFLVFHWLLQARRTGVLQRRPVIILGVLFLTLLASAANRFGGDVIGGLQRYIVGYHLVGFSYYDHQYLNPNSILHTHSLGRSSLGFLDQMLEAVLKMLGVGYRAASFQNAEFNELPIDIGLDQVREFNAFGTFLFSLYRDFNVLGIVGGGFLYGALATHALYRSKYSWLSGAFFLLLAASWMMGMMVNPLEEAYFWFTIVALGVFSLVNRRRSGLRRRPATKNLAPAASQARPSGL
jgi:oligosaccharide repeat unit polymerase